MKRTRQIVITKRDGTLERFSFAKLTNCLATAMRGQAYDPRLAEPLARAVAMHLQDWADPKPPTSGYIYRCVRSVLRQTGLGEVAEDLASHRRRRSTRRRRIRVLGTDPAQRRGASWQKAALVETLQHRYGIRHSVARVLAGQIEQQVFALDYRVISKTFMAELVRNEVLAWGLADEQVLRASALSCPPPVGTHQTEEEH